MKLTIRNIKILKKDATPLQNSVYDYIIDEWDSYDNKVNIFTDVLYHGCQSGTVGFLIYYNQTTAFYNKHKDEINELLYEIMESTGIYSPTELFGKKWEKEDPLAIEDYNQNLLAWFGFEETLRKIGQNFEQLENYI